MLNTLRSARLLFALFLLYDTENTLADLLGFLFSADLSDI